MKVTTLRTTANDCSNKWDCPSVHELDTDPGRRYVVSVQASAVERVAFAHVLGDGQVLGWVPAGFLPAGNLPTERTPDVRHPDLHPDRQYVITDLVRDPTVLAVFGDLMSRGEQLGTVPAHDLAMI